MLVLSRKPNEQILIGENVVITVVAIRGGHVRLGIDAPREIPVHRKEVFDALREATESPPLSPSQEGDDLKSTTRSPPV